MNLSFERIPRVLLKRFTAPAAQNLFLLWLAIVSAGWGMSSAIRGYPTGLVAIACLLGVPLAWWAADRLTRRIAAAVVLFSLGVFMITVQAGGLLGALANSMIQTINLGLQLIHAFLLQVFAETPPPVFIKAPAAWFDLANGLTLVSGRFINWLSLFLQKEAFYDEAAVTIWWSSIAWILAWWAGFCFRISSSALLSTAPAGILLAALLNRSLGDPKLLLPFLGFTLALLSSSSYLQARQRWETDQLDMPDNLGVDTTIWVSLLVTAVLGIGFVTADLPALSHETLRAVTASLRPVEEPGNPANDALGIQPANRMPTPPTRYGGFSLPRQHLIGAGPELSEKPALFVEILSDSLAMPENTSPPTYYLRGLVYDIYQQAGWASSAVQTQQYLAREMIQELEANTTGLRQVEQKIILEPSQRGLVLTAGNPLAVDHDTQLNLRSSPLGNFDLFGMGIAELEYRAWSALPFPSASQLRQANQEIPAWIRQRYLQLPENLPQRVIDLAATFTDLSNSFDKAVAIEAYLRIYPYSLDIPAPPSDRDIVDFFLFDLKQGYCDYFASAMVVLARLNGLPSRLVIGYVASIYDPAMNGYPVLERMAHSWVEVYFPGYGWIPFEPTSGQTAIQREDQVSVAIESPISTLSPPEWLRTSRAWWRNRGIPFLSLAGIVVLLGLVFFPFIDRWWVGKDGIPLAITRVYRRFERMAGHVTGPQPPGLTPFETSAAFSARLSGEKWLTPKARKRILADAHTLTELYVMAAYAPQQRTITDLRHAWTLLGRLESATRLVRVWKNPSAHKRNERRSNSLD